MSLKELEQHFEFGENWEIYSKTINENSIEIAKESLQFFFDCKDIKNKSFIDIGCGSGLFSIAALRLGFKKVVSVDIDPICIKVAKQNISKYWTKNNWEYHNISVFELKNNKIGNFDVVYSWGVLHHTGAMYEAIDCSLKLLKPNGYMLVGLYQKTLLCSFWKIEKLFYSKSPKVIQKIIRNIFLILYGAIYFFRGQNQSETISNYSQGYRAMDYNVDLHDWLGGYPYESISPENFRMYIKQFGFNVKSEKLCTEGLGLTGSGINEYLIYKTDLN